MRSSRLSSRVAVACDAGIKILEESLKNFNTNERVMGTVLSIAPNEVQVDVGRRQYG